MSSTMTAPKGDPKTDGARRKVVAPERRPRRARGGKLTFNGTEIHVYDATEPSDTDIVIVTFPARTNRQGLDRKGFGQAFLDKKGFPAVYVTASRNHWFQTPETDAAIEAVTAITRRFKRVVTYGSSMGAYGALNWSARLHASAIIAISPQFSIQRRVVPWEKRWAEEAAILDFTDDDMARNISRAAVANVIYDPRTPDLRHAAAIQAILPNMAPILIPFGGHPAGTFLRDSRLLSRCIHGLMTGTLKGQDVRLAIRAERRAVAVYWANLSATLHRLKKAGAMEAGLKSVEIDPQNANTCYMYGKLLFRFRQTDNALHWMRRAVDLAPQVERYKNELAAMLDAPA